MWGKNKVRKLMDCKTAATQQAIMSSLPRAWQVSFFSLKIVILPYHVHHETKHRSLSRQSDYAGPHDTVLVISLHVKIFRWLPSMIPTSIYYHALTPLIKQSCHRTITSVQYRMQATLVLQAILLLSLHYSPAQNISDSALSVNQVLQ
jgi:hypothetical protein